MKIGIIGVTGRMGKAVLACAERDSELSCLWGISSHDQKTTPLPSVDVIIDFSLPDALSDNLLLAEKLNTPIVIGTTGIDEKKLVPFSKRLPIFWSPNFSLGLFAQALSVEIIAKLLPSMDTSIEETHHTHKKDSPSGSALFLKKILEKTGATPLVTSKREGDIVGIHSVLFSGEEEKLTVSHEAFSRDAFAKGAITAAKFLRKQPPGLYRMHDLLS